MKTIEKFTTKIGKIVEIVGPSLDRLDDVLRFANKLAKEDTYLSFHPQKEILRPDEEIWLKGTIKGVENGSTLFYWAIFDGKIVGSVDIHRGKSIREWHIGTIGLMVDSDFRGEGLGRFLLEFVIQKAKEAGIRTAILGVFADNDIAHNLYKKIGFAQYGLLPDGLYRKKKFVDHIYMYKQLLD